jgi:hypothetical protein
LKRNPEFNVYRNLIELLEKNNWLIICASPPGGTDNRFRKCLFPKKTTTSDDKGLRDELDIIALKNNQLILIECKPLLSQSLKHENALGESDYQKLNRIMSNTTSQILSEMLQQGTGIEIPSELQIHLALGVGKIDQKIPEKITIFEVGHKNKIYPYGYFKDDFD